MVGPNAYSYTNSLTATGGSQRVSAASIVLFLFPPLPPPLMAYHVIEVRPPHKVPYQSKWFIHKDTDAYEAWLKDPQADLTYVNGYGMNVIHWLIFLGWDPTYVKAWTDLVNDKNVVLQRSTWDLYYQGKFWLRGTDGLGMRHVAPWSVVSYPAPTYVPVLFRDLTGQVKLPSKKRWDAIVFDFDYTLISKHTGGAVANPLDYVCRLQELFLYVLRHCMEQDIKVGIATNGDERMATSSRPYAGERLVRHILEHAVRDFLAAEECKQQSWDEEQLRSNVQRWQDSVSIAAAYPALHNNRSAFNEFPMPAAKQWHLEKLFTLWNWNGDDNDTRRRRVLFVDDSKPIIQTMKGLGYTTLHVTTHGVTLKEWNQCIEENEACPDL